MSERNPSQYYVENSFANISATSFIDAEGEIKTLATLEREAIVFAIQRCKGLMTEVARSLGIGRSTLYRKLRKYGLDQDDYNNETQGVNDVQEGNGTD